MTMTVTQMSERRLIAVLIAAGVLSLAGVLGLLVGVAPAAAEEVKIDNFTFNPPQITVKAGTTVTWTNSDDIPHTVVASERQFRSKAMDTGDKFSFTFTSPGVYDYFCSLHPHMVGKIVVDVATGSNAK